MSDITKFKLKKQQLYLLQTIGRKKKFKPEKLKRIQSKKIVPNLNRNWLKYLNGFKILKSKELNSI